MRRIRGSVLRARPSYSLPTHSLYRRACVDGLSKRGPNFLFRAAGPAFVEARVLDLDCKVVAGAVAPDPRTRGALCPPVPAVLARGPNIVQDSELCVLRG